MPKVVINDAHEFVGALPEPAFVAAVARAVSGGGAPAEAETPAEGETTPLSPDGRPGDNPIS